MKMVVTAGPIPARLDSVKYVSNRFKGRLAVRTASELSRRFDIELICWRWADLGALDIGGFKVRRVEDVMDYKEAVLSAEADVYLLAAAVANLMPSEPWEGKFPSHLYSPGAEFSVKFRISPRVIDEVKALHPRSTLIGYKLFDGTEEELVRAGFETMRGSRANVVFCNHPATAKDEKIALTPDGSRIRMSFGEHVAFIDRAAKLVWWRTLVSQFEKDGDAMAEASELMEALSRRTFTRTSDAEHEPSFGTFAVKAKRGFVTTTRGKRGRGLCQVLYAEPSQRTVCADVKATMNAPTLARMFDFHPRARYVVHSHQQLPGVRTFPYAFPGTTEEDAIPVAHFREFNVEHHGCYAAFDTKEELLAWTERHRI